MTLVHGKGILHKNIPRICQRHLNIFLEKLERGVETTHTPPIAKVTPMPKYMKIKKVPTTKTTQNALKYKVKTIYC